jgi:hypothetical protein
MARRAARPSKRRDAEARGGVLAFRAAASDIVVMARTSPRPHGFARQATVGQVKREHLRARLFRPADRRRAGDDFVIGMGDKNENAPTEHAASQSQAPPATR